MGAGNDIITGTNAADIIDAGDGDDVVNALGGNDTITGGKGNDILNGGAGNDTYNYARGDGNDTITELSLGGSSDRLVFTGINQADVTLVRNGTDVTIVIAESAPGAGDGGSILLKDNFEDVTDRGIDRIVFADSSSWTRAGLRAAYLAQVSTGGNDTITGFNAADTITGGAGNDILSGGNGNDTYNYARGSGNDTIIEAASGGTDDRLVLAGINPSAVTLLRNGNDVTLVIAESAPGAGNGGSILLKDNFEEYYDQGIDKIVFGDGTIWTRAQLRSAFLAQVSTSGDDVITGFDGADTINAGQGNDEVHAGNGADILAGGAGNDVLYGGAESDTYYYARGDGNDTIQEDSGGGSDDRLVLTGINPPAVTVVRNGNDALLVIAESAPGAGDSGSILLKANFDEDNGRGIDKIVFADATAWTRADLRTAYLAQHSTAGNDTIVGFGGADVINAGAGNDTVDAGGGNDIITGGTGDDLLAGGDGSDTYHYARGDGNDTIVEGASGGGEDRLVLDGLSRSDITLVRNGKELRILVSDSAPGAHDGGSILLTANFDDYPNTGIDGIVLAGGVTLSKNDLVAGVDYIGGASGDETIVGTAANEIVRAGTGNDILLGGGGNDAYHYARGDGNDTIIENSGGGTDDRLVLENINADAATLVRNGNDVTIVIAQSAPGAGDGGSILIKDTLNFDYSQSGIESVVFGDNTVWTRTAIRLMLLDQASTTGDDTIVGFDTADTIDGLAGNDSMEGAGGDDTYLYARGDGNDSITERMHGGSNDRLVFTDINPSDVTLVRNGNDVTVVIAESAPGAGDGGSVLLKDTLDDNWGQGVEKIVFADNTTWIWADIRVEMLDRTGTSGNDTITGFNVNDTIRGRGGNDVMNGAGGDDTYVYARGDGNDTIVEDAWNGTNDRLVFADINPAALTLVRNGNDVTVVVAESAPGAGDGGSVLLKNTLDDNWGQGVDKIVFANGTEWTRAQIREMLVSASGTNGDDTISGTSYSDIIAGRGGNDALYGAGGDDTYIYARGDGNDTITEDAWNGTGDKLAFTNINPSDVTLVRNGNDVTVVIVESAPGAGDGGSVLIKNTLDDSFGRGVEKIAFADGTTWTIGQVRQFLLDQAATAGNNTIVGFNTADTLHGNGGNDALNGAAGDDTYLYAGGDGNDTITEDFLNGSNDRLMFTNINPAAVTLVRNGNDVTVVVAESAPGAGDGGSVLLKDTLDDYLERGVDKIVFADNTTWSRADIRVKLLDQAGTAGNDTITGFNVNDTIRGRGGNDSLNGASGDDIYVYARGDGNDTITETYNNGSNDQLVFTDINPAAVSLARNGNDVTVVIAERAPGVGDGGSVLLKNSLDDASGQGVDKIVFADNTAWTRADIRVKLLDQAGTAGNDTITGFNVNDTIRGRGGNDSLNGASGDDTYVYARGDGNDTITETYNNGSNDQLVFTNINPAAVSLARNGNDVTVVIAESAPGAGDGGSVLLKNSLDDSSNQGLEKIAFADGTIWTRAQLRDMLLISTTADDILVGFMGNDTFHYARGGGNDTIIETYNNGDSDQLVFTDINPAAVSLMRNGNDVTVVIADSAPGAGNSGSVLLKNSLDDSSNQGVEKIVFANGATWTRADIRVALLDQAATAGNDTIAGFNVNDTIRGRGGNDVMNGAGGDDTYIYARGDGNDSITEGVNGGNNDRLVFTDINPAAVTLLRNGNDVTVVVAESAPGAGDGGSVLLKNSLANSGGQGVDKIVFADNTVWTTAELIERANATVSYTSNANAVSVDLDLGTVVVTNPALAGQFIRIYQTNGNYLSLAEVQVFENGQNTALTGTASQKSTGWGGDASRAIDGNTDGNFNHNSVTHTGTANVGEWWQVNLGRTVNVDEIVVFNRTDGFSYRLGDFDVVITGQALSSSATLQDAISQPGARVVHYTGTFPASDTVFEVHETHALQNIKYVVGSSFDDTLRGDASANSLFGGLGNDIIEGRGGQDLLTGGGGSDTFIFRAGFGQDNITDFVAGAGSADFIQFANNVFDDFASVLAAASQVGADTVITHDAGNVLTLKNVALANLHQDDFQFIAA